MKRAKKTVSETVLDHLGRVIWRRAVRARSPPALWLAAAQPHVPALPAVGQDALLERWVAAARRVPAAAVVLVWLAALTHGFGDRVLALDNLWVLAVVLPLCKAVHELAHAWAVMLRGGEVHKRHLWRAP